MLPTLRISADVALPDNHQWQFRFEVKSETSDRVYIISQNKKRRFWACSCPGWKRHRKCKHLIALDLPCHEQPMEVNLQKA
ncbi:MAG: SWIM zinc finger family protein [Sphingobacteriales bacterium]|nr:SWIM zinc finger family protein [Sphingobacteriales bacterium]